MTHKKSDEEKEEAEDSGVFASDRELPFGLGLQKPEEKKLPSLEFENCFGEDEDEEN